KPLLMAAAAAAAAPDWVIKRLRFIPCLPLLSPPRFARRQVRPHDVWVQLDTEPRLFCHFDEAILDIRPVEHEDLIHPVTLASNGFKSDVVVNRCRPLRGRIGVY